MTAGTVNVLSYALLLGSFAVAWIVALGAYHSLRWVDAERKAWNNPPDRPMFIRPSIRHMVR